MFVSQGLTLDVSFVEARARLMTLTHGGWLSTASQGARTRRASSSRRLLSILR